MKDTIRDSFILYAAQGEAVERLSDTEAGKLLKGLYRYARLGEECGNISPTADLVWLFLRGQLDRDAQKYAEKVERNRENGGKGGRPRKTVENSQPDNAGDNSKATHKPRARQGQDDGAEGFAAFWDAYPRKVGRAEAVKAFAARIAEGFSPEELTTAAKNYSADCEKNRTEERYIKHARTFLGAATPFADYIKGETPAAGDPYDNLTPGANPFREDAG